MDEVAQSSPDYDFTVHLWKNLEPAQLSEFHQSATSQGIFPTLTDSTAQIENELQDRTKKKVGQKARSTEANTETNFEDRPWRVLRGKQKADLTRRNSNQSKDQIANLPDGTFAPGSTAANAVAIAAPSVQAVFKKLKRKAAEHPGEAGSKQTKQGSITDKEKTDAATTLLAKQAECAEKIYKDRQAKPEIDKGNEILCTNMFEALVDSNMEIEEEETIPEASGNGHESLCKNNVSLRLDKRLQKKQGATPAKVVKSLEKEMLEACGNLNPLEALDHMIECASTPADVAITQPNKSNTALVHELKGNAIPAKSEAKAKVKVEEEPPCAASSAKDHVVAPCVAPKMDSLDKRRPKKDEAIMVMTKEAITIILDSKSGFAICNRNFKKKDYWLGDTNGTRCGIGEIQGFATVTKTRKLEDISELMSVSASHNKQGLKKLPYANTYVVSLKNATRVDPVKFEHRRAHGGIVKYADMPTGDDYQDLSMAPVYDEVQPNLSGIFLDNKSVNPVVSNFAEPRKPRRRARQTQQKTCDVLASSSYERSGMEANPAGDTVLPSIKPYDESAFAKQRKRHVDGLGGTGEDDEKEALSGKEQRNAMIVARKTELQASTLQYIEMRNAFLIAELPVTAFGMTRDALRKDRLIPKAMKTVLLIRCCLDEYLREDAMLHRTTYVVKFLPEGWEDKEVGEALKQAPNLLTKAKLKVLMVEARKLDLPEKMLRLHQQKTPLVRVNQLQGDVKRLRNAASILNLTHRVLLGQAMQQADPILKRQTLEEVETLQSLESKYIVAHDIECMMALKTISTGVMPRELVECFKPLRQSFLAEKKIKMDKDAFKGCPFSCGEQRCKGGNKCQVLQAEQESSSSLILTQLNLGGFPNANRHSNLNLYSRLALPDYWKPPQEIQNVRRQNQGRISTCPLQNHQKAKARGLYCKNGTGCEGGLRCFRASGHDTYNKFRLLLLREKRIDQRNLDKLMTARVKAAANAKKKRKEQPRASFFKQKKWNKTIALGRSSKLLLRVQDVVNAMNAYAAKNLAAQSAKVSKLIERHILD